MSASDLEARLPPCAAISQIFFAGASYAANPVATCVGSSGQIDQPEWPTDTEFSDGHNAPLPASLAMPGGTSTSSLIRSLNALVLYQLLNGFLILGCAWS
jgi:hypothetical protein